MQNRRCQLTVLVLAAAASLLTPPLVDCSPVPSAAASPPRPDDLKILSRVGQLGTGDRIGDENDDIDDNDRNNDDKNSSSRKAGPKIHALLTQMYNDIIKSRLANLLQGVERQGSFAPGDDHTPPSSMRRADALAAATATAVANRNSINSSKSENRRRLAANGGDDGNRTVQVFLPEPVTEIPLKLFTSLPG